MLEYKVNHITSSPHYPPIKWFGEEVCTDSKEPVYKAKDEGTDLFKSVMIHCNTTLTSNLQSPMLILQSRTARSQLPISNAARKELGLHRDQLRAKSKNEHFTSHDLHVG